MQYAKVTNSKVSYFNGNHRNYMTVCGYTKQSGCPTNFMVQLEGSNRWYRVMCYQISNTSILIFGGFDRQNRTNASFVYNTSNKTIERSADLPTVGSYSTMVFQIEDALYTVGWNNQKKNLYKFNITGGYWKVDEDFTI